MQPEHCDPAPVLACSAKETRSSSSCTRVRLSSSTPTCKSHRDAWVVLTPAEGARTDSSGTSLSLATAAVHAPQRSTSHSHNIPRPAPCHILMPVRVAPRRPPGPASASGPPASSRVSSCQWRPAGQATAKLASSGDSVLQVRRSSPSCAFLLRISSVIGAAPMRLSRLVRARTSRCWH